MPLIFLLFPFLELWTLIELGAAQGAFVALGWVALTIFVGLGMIRRQGLSMIRQIQREAEGGLISTRFLGDDLAVVTSGMLLMIPGLITDCMAIIVLIGPLRRRLMGAAPAHFPPVDRVTVTRRYTSDGGKTYTETRTFTDSSTDSGTDSGTRSRNDDANVTVEGDFRRLDD